MIHFFLAFQNGKDRRRVPLGYGSSHRLTHRTFLLSAFLNHPMTKVDSDRVPKPRPTHIRCVKPSTCGPKQNYCVNGKIVLRFGDGEDQHVTRCVLEQWHADGEAPQARSMAHGEQNEVMIGIEAETQGIGSSSFIPLIFRGRWRSECAPLLPGDVVEVCNASVVDYEDVKELQSVHDDDTVDDEVHNYCLVLNDFEGTASDPSVKSPDGFKAQNGASDSLPPSIRVLFDAPPALDLNRKKRHPKQVLSSLSAVSSDTLGALLWHPVPASHKVPSRAVESLKHLGCDLHGKISRQRHRYTKLNDLRLHGESTLNDVHVIGVIVDVRAPRRTRGMDWITELQIIDPSIVNIDALVTGEKPVVPKVILTSFNKSLDSCIPYVGIGDVIRAHRVLKEWYCPQQGDSAGEPILQLKIGPFSSMCLWRALGDSDDDGLSRVRAVHMETVPKKGDQQNGATNEECPDPYRTVYPSHTKQITISFEEKAHAFEMLIWARQLLSRTGFLGNNAFASTLNRIQRDCTDQRISMGERFKKRYDLMVRLFEHVENSASIDLYVNDGTVSAPIAVRIPTQFWPQMSHHSLPIHCGSWLRLRDVRLVASNDSNCILCMQDASSIFLLPEWMPDVDCGMIRLSRRIPFPPDEDLLRLEAAVNHPETLAPDGHHDEGEVKVSINPNAMRSDGAPTEFRSVAPRKRKTAGKTNRQGVPALTSSTPTWRQYQWSQDWFGPPAIGIDRDTAKPSGMKERLWASCVDLVPWTVAEMVMDVYEKLCSETREALISNQPFVYRVRGNVLAMSADTETETQPIWFHLSDSCSVHKRYSVNSDDCPVSPGIPESINTLRVTVWVTATEVKRSRVPSSNTDSNEPSADKHPFTTIREHLVSGHTWVDCVLLVYGSDRNGFPSNVSAMDRLRHYVFFQLYRSKVHPGCYVSSFKNASSQPHSANP